MKEIGGYFGLEDFQGQEYYHDLVAVNNARNALIYIVRAKKIKKLYIPYFLCESVSIACQREGCPCEYYYIDKDFKPVFDHTLEDGEYLYVVNYYGQLDKEYISELKSRYDRIIVDNVQAFFTRPMDGIDTVYSCRKFFGVPDGGYVATDAILDEEISQDVSMDRMKHVLGRYEGACAGDYYNEFKANDHAFMDLELRAMSKLTRNILRAVDYENAKKKREENFAKLHSALGDINPLKIKTCEGPYAYPFYFKDGMKLKKLLAENKIFVATLWPNVLSMDGTIEKDYAENILPLPCDQRYDATDMDRIIYQILKAM